MIKADELSKMALTACLSVIFTGATAWMVFGQDKISRDEASAMVASSILSNTSALDLRIKTNESLGAELKSNLSDLVKAQQALVVEQRVLIERVNQLVERLGK